MAPVDFYVDIANVYGRCEAIVLSQIMERCVERPSLHDKKHWCVLSQDKLAVLVGYSSESVKRAVKHLVQAGLLEVGCFNEDKHDRTNWYRLAEQA